MASSPKKSKDERREEALRPNPWLGYDRDSVAVHLVSRGAYDIAEPQFRRAIWLNPYEPRFKQHLAWCLFKAKRFAEAEQWITKALAQDPENPESRRLLDLIVQRVGQG